MQYNESSRGNLRRCLENLSQYCDDIVVYDDGSRDDSASVCREYTDHVIEGGKNDFLQETAHRQRLLEAALALGPDYVFWLDADEVLDREGSTGGLRALCDGRAWDFEEVTLWRSTSWRRTDYLGHGRFTRLWPNNGKLRIPVTTGLHRQLYPDGLPPVAQAPFRVLHYGYATKEAILRRWAERTRLGVPIAKRKRCLEETKMVLEMVPEEWFPQGAEYHPDPKPQPIHYGICTWDAERRGKHLYVTLLKEHADLLTGRILMLGCNSGTTLDLIPGAVGVDIAREAMRRGVNADALALPFRSGSFDTILALDFVEHVLDTHGLVSECRRVLRDGGRMLVFVPRTDPVNPSAVAMSPDHVHWYETPEQLSGPWETAFSIDALVHETRENPGMSGRHDAWLMRLSTSS